MLFDQAPTLPWLLFVSPTYFKLPGDANKFQGDDQTKLQSDYYFSSSSASIRLDVKVCRMNK